MIWNKIGPDKQEATLFVDDESIRVIVWKDELPVGKPDGSDTRTAFCYSVSFWSEGRGVTGQIWSTDCSSMSDARDRAIAALRHACPKALVWCQAAML